jgi:hypothetical protein
LAGQLLCVCKHVAKVLKRAGQVALGTRTSPILLNPPKRSRCQPELDLSCLATFGDRQASALVIIQRILELALGYQNISTHREIS